MAETDIKDGFWVFAYGSLIWNPGFVYQDRVQARLDGYHRAFCMASVVYRGTPEAPGLVLALDRKDGAACHGVAYRVGADTAAKALAYLRDRELVSSAYLEQQEQVVLTDGRVVKALCYVIDRGHEQYRGTLDREGQAQVIAWAEGPAGSNRDYLFRTADSLHQLGISDPDLDWLAERVGDLARFRD